jgi:hypothetical protein
MAPLDSVRARHERRQAGNERGQRGRELEILLTRGRKEFVI